MSRKHPSRVRFGEGFVLTEENMAWYQDQYVPDRARTRRPARLAAARARPRRPSARVHRDRARDPLRDEGEAYAERLRAAGVTVALHRHPQVHGFFNLTAMRSALRGLTLLAGALRQGLA